jgi:hypothetical protein
MAIYKAAHSRCRILWLANRVEERTKAQEYILSILVKARGVELIDLLNAEGKIP